MLDLIAQRRSIRKYHPDKPVEPEKLEAILESARLAPSGSNTQPWHFIVVKSEAQRRRIAEVTHQQDWMNQAPIHIVCVGDIRSRIDADTPISLDETTPIFELKQVIRDTSIAIEHMVLTAESLGLGTCWASWFMQKDIRPVLNIPEDKFVVTVLTLGYPAETPKARPRKALSAMYHEEFWQPK